MRTLALVLAGTVSIPALVHAQTAEDVAWARAEGCDGIRQFVWRYPNTRFVMQVQARLISLNCLKPAGTSGGVVSTAPPTSAAALLDGVAPPPIGDLLDVPAPTVRLVSTRAVKVEPCPTNLGPKEQCRTQILGVSYDGRRFALTRTAGEFTPWNFRDGEKEVYHPTEYSSPVIFSSADLAEIATLKAPEGNHGLQDAPMSDMGNLVFLSDGERVVTQGSSDGWSFPWTLSSATYGSGGTPQQELVASPEQKYLFATSVGAGNYCSIYAYTGDYEWLDGYSDPKKPENCSIDYFNASADSEVLAVGYVNDLTVEDPNSLRDTVAAVRWRETKSLLEVPGTIGAISPTASLLAAWGPKSGRALTTGSVYDLWSGKRVFTMSGHVGGVTSLAWSPDSERLATGGADAIVNLWNARTGQKIATFGGFPGPVCALQFTRKGRGLITKCEKVVRVYDAATGRQVKAFVPADDGLLSVEVSGDGSTVVEVRSGSKATPVVAVWQIAG